jgi:phage antirepressor YoqD-like protein
MQNKPLTISVAQFCQMLGIGRTLAFRYLAEQRVQSVLVGRRRLVVLASVESLLEGGER